jgi:integrase
VATLQQRNGSYRVLFLHFGKRHTFTLGKVSEKEAQAKSAQVDYILLRLKQKLIELPPGVDIVTFMELDGRPPDDEQAVPKRVPTTLAVLRDRYLETHRGALEATTIDGMQLHFKHLVLTLGERFPVQELSLSHLQEHAERRKRMKGIRGKVSSATIRKELVSLRTAWNWGVHMELVSGRFPSLKRVKMPKPEEKPHFQTRAEIERQIGSLDKKQIAELWDAMYLTKPEVDELLAHVKTTAMQPWVYPMFCFAAHTGARRSEMLRAMVADVDFVGATVVIHEKKRAHDRRTTRRVPLTPFLAAVLKEWLTVSPASPNLFAQAAKVVRSKTKRSAATPITPDEAHDHFKRTLAASKKWSVIRGWHIFRHSFISLCASRAVDQRLIDEWVGHQTEEQRKRYRHLLPSMQQEAIRSVFGE